MTPMVPRGDWRPAGTRSMRGLVAALLVMAGPASAADVYVNGVSVEGLTNQSFEKVTVRLDEKGNVHIEAPGYTVKRVTVADPVQPTGVITQRYFLVTEQSTPGAAGYDIDVVVNGKLLRTLSSAEPQLVLEVTRELRPGQNTVTLRARKLPQAKGRRDGRPGLFRVLLGEGTSKGEQVTIERQLVTFTRTEAETNDVTQEFSLTTR